MSVLYDMYPIKDIADSSNDGLYRAKAVSKGTIDIERLIERMADVYKFNNAQTKGMITALEDTILYYLERGYDVQLGNIGYLSVSVTSRLVKNKKELRAESVHFKKLNFRISQVMRKKLELVTTEKAPFSRDFSSALPLERKELILKKYLEENTCATRTDYCKMTATLKSNAIRELNAFMEAGWLKKYGSGRTVVYILNKEK